MGFVDRKKQGFGLDYGEISTGNSSNLTPQQTYAYQILQPPSIHKLNTLNPHDPIIL